MAKINVSYDTDTKEFLATLDGAKLENVVSAKFESQTMYEGSEGKGCNVCVSMVDKTKKANGYKTYMDIVTAAQIDTKQLLKYNGLHLETEERK